MPKVSVIIPTYNGLKYLPEALDSVMGQIFQDFEVVVVDDGSTDNTREFINEYTKKYPNKIRYIYQENQGLTARNTGIKNARGELIAFLDADDKWFPRRLEQGVKVLESDPETALVHANMERISEKGISLGVPTRQTEFLSGFIFEHLFLRRADISCSTVLFKKSCCDKVGMIDKNLARLGSEDRELWLRFAREFKITYIDQVLAFYRVNTGGWSYDQERMFKARHYIIDKFCAVPEYKKLKRPALAKIFRDSGDEALLARQFSKACKEYAKSIWYKPCALWAWINLIKAVLQIKVKK